MKKKIWFLAGMEDAFCDFSLACERNKTASNSIFSLVCVAPSYGEGNATASELCAECCCCLQSNSFLILSRELALCSVTRERNCVALVAYTFLGRKESKPLAHNCHVGRVRLTCKRIQRGGTRIISPQRRERRNSSRGFFCFSFASRESRQKSKQIRIITFQLSPAANQSRVIPCFFCPHFFYRLD